MIGYAFIIFSLLIIVSLGGMMVEEDNKVKELFTYVCLSSIVGIIIIILVLKGELVV